MWLISHPDKVSIAELHGYNDIFVASNVWGNENLAPHGISFEPLLQCTNSSRFFPRPAEPDIKSGNLFVANSRLTERTIVRDAKLEHLE